MASDYDKIREENRSKYGTEIGRIGAMFLANLYSDRTHFIFELLQNAEDALRRRAGRGSRTVSFSLSKHFLRVSHFGEPFTEKDVQGICGIAESTKPELTAIGRFGIGFKAVYAFTKAPAIHSGEEHFAIDSFVWPRAIPATDMRPGETVFEFPFEHEDAAAFPDISKALQALSVRTLLFLKEIDSISWEIKGGARGTYVRESKRDKVAENATRVKLVGEDGKGKGLVEEAWLVFSRSVKNGRETIAGNTEVAFALENESGPRRAIARVADSKLVVFFPTIEPTNLGFLIQGPYRTTPSRESVPAHDAWNQDLVRRTAGLLVEALKAIRDRDLLSVQALQVLPLDASKFGEGSMFRPLFEAVRTALLSGKYLPTNEGGYASAKEARLARGQDLRALLAPGQLGALFGPPKELRWLHEDITADRTSELRLYLMRELQVAELDLGVVLPRLSRAFLEKQSDEWLVACYEALLGQPALWRFGGVRDKPFVRLANGAHVAAWRGNQPQAFLPTKRASEFPTVKASIAKHAKAREFLKQLDIGEPDPIDEIISHVLPKYRADKVNVDGDEYAGDVERILEASRTDSQAQRDRLIASLAQIPWVIASAADTGGGGGLVRPGEAYWPTEKLVQLFKGIPGVLFVDHEWECMRGDSMRALLEVCGTSRYLVPVDTKPAIDADELHDLRVTESGSSRSTGSTRVRDITLRGIDGLLQLLPQMDSDLRKSRAALLWHALADLENRNRGAFQGTHEWYYYTDRSAHFDAAFLKQLNQSAWIPDEEGELHRPNSIIFETLSWPSNPFLESKIRFQPPAVATLAKEAGVDLGVLEFVKRAGLTVEQLRDKFGDQAFQHRVGEITPAEALAALGIGDPTPGVRDPGGPEPIGAPGTGTTVGGAVSYPRSTNSAGGRPFISYVAAHARDDPADPDGLEHAARQRLEQLAIAHIRREEPRLVETPTNNPGFDLIELGADGAPARWVEVKAMTGPFSGRPVGLSRKQFEAAQGLGAAYWLYVVENAGSARPRTIKIQDPAGKARTFTFDRGWLESAVIENQEKRIGSDGKD